MRALVPGLATLALAAGAAHGQPLPPQAIRPVSPIQLQTQIDMLRAQLDMVRQQQVGMANEVNAMDARARTERNLALLHAATHPPPAPVIRPGASAADLGELASIPDAALADSDAKVRAAARNRR